MKTDKQVFRIFEAQPEWLFQLTGLESPGDCRLESFTMKALERRADGLVVPANPSQPLTLVEFQFQDDETIYARTVQEMAAAQLKNEMRAIEGMILFAYNELDPKTEPWTRSVRSFAFKDLLDALEEAQPGHPLAAVFKPLFVEDDKALADSAVKYYRQIEASALDEPVKAALLEVFVSWLEQRFRELTKKEIEDMLIGELPDLEETRSGKDLIAIGERRGKKKGKIEAILAFLEAKHGSVPKELKSSARDLSSVKVGRLLAHLPHCETLDDVQAWFDEHA